MCFSLVVCRNVKGCSYLLKTLFKTFLTQLLQLPRPQTKYKIQNNVKSVLTEKKGERSKENTTQEKKIAFPK